MEIGVNIPKHRINRLQRIDIVIQRRKHVCLEPAMNMRQNGCRHFCLAAGKRVVEAAFPKTGRLGHARHAGPVKAVFTKNLRERLYQLVAGWGRVRQAKGPDRLTTDGLLDVGTHDPNETCGPFLRLTNH